MTLTRRSLLALPVTLAAAPAAPRLLVCGGNTLYDARLGGPAAGPHWEDIRAWSAERSPGLPLRYTLRAFETTDECKPIDGGRRVLTTSSSGGVAIYDRESLATSFYAHVPNAHSACPLPDGHVAVASSVHDSGNAIVLFHRRRPETPIFRTPPLESAHGVLWDEKRNVLYAIGMRELREYRFTPRDAAAPLRLETTTPLPSTNGHELAPRGSDELLVSTTSQVLIFDRRARRFAPHPELGPMRHIKSVSVHPETGRIAYVRADEGGWWTFRLRFLQPEGEVESPGQKIYKARWA